MKEAVTTFSQTEHWVEASVQWLKLGVELVGAIIIGLGIVASGALLAKALLARRTADFTAIRLTLARYLALALEFQLGADILSTAIAPNWEEIGKLGAVAIIRTALNYFLSKEMQEERKQSTSEQQVVHRSLTQADADDARKK